MSQYYLLMTRTEMPTKTSIPVTEYLYGGNIPLKKQNIKNQAWLEAYVTADVKNLPNNMFPDQVERILENLLLTSTTIFYNNIPHFTYTDL